MCTDLNLFDAWRVLHFFQTLTTAFHESIIFFFTSRQVLDRLEEDGIGTHTLSDHSPINICLPPPFYDVNSRQWRLDPYLLSSRPFMTYIKEQFEAYMTINDVEDISPSILWEAAKAYLRGAII